MAMSFVSASSQYISLGANLSSLQNAAAATLTAWVNPTNVAGTELFIINFSNNTATNTGRATLTQRSVDNAWRGSGRRLDADAVSVVNSASTITAGVVTHIAVILNYTGGALTIFINGVQSNTLAIAGWTGNTSNTVSLAATLAVRADASAGTFFNGILDGVRVYNRALTANEINTIYRANGKDSIINGLVHRYVFFEAVSGTVASGAGTIKDKGTGKINGTPTNSPTYASAIIGNRRRRR